MKKKKNILNYLFFCIIINMIPTIMLGTFNVQSGIYTALNAIVYVIEVLVMTYAVKDNIKKVSNKKISLLLIFLCIQVMTQLINYIRQDSIMLQDIMHIVSVIINIFIFMICASFSKIEKDDMISFMRKMVSVGVVACIYNIIANGMNMLNISNLISSYSASFSSFFPNRNQFGIFMIIMVLSNLYMKKSNKSIYYKFTELFFIINLVLTMSRNSIVGLICIYIIKFYIDCLYTSKISKTKLLFVTLLIFIAIFAMFYIWNNENYREIINRLFIRSDTLETGSGRTIVWENGINIVLDNNFLLGVGRFNGIQLNKTLYNSDLEYFHSIYIETFVIYGITGIIMLFLLFKYIIKRIKKSLLDVEYKNILLTSIFVFMIISIFETTTRFSIGYADMMSMIYFIVIPIIFTTIKVEEKEDGEG